MGEWLGQLGVKLKTQWKKWTLVQKSVLAGAALVSVMGVVVDRKSVV